MTAQLGRLAVSLAILLAAAAILTGCGQGTGPNDIDPGNAAQAPDYSAALARAPAPLRRLYEPGGTLIPGGEPAYLEQLDGLRGFPVVVNNWASWCGPCREEFPYFQAQAAERLDEVAFLGVDSQDSSDAAQTFLGSHPLPYPSVEDPDGDFGPWLKTRLLGLPNTAFYNRDGELTFVKQGPFADEAELAAAIDRYALQDE
jgi:cytochrome c biogenesis protein CcmG, thiol:disulfide interchange protein DsbE